MIEKPFITKINFTQVQGKHYGFLIIYHEFCMIKLMGILDYKFLFFFGHASQLEES